jgi:hypothetical protein
MSLRDLNSQRDAERERADSLEQEPRQARAQVKEE